MPLSADFADGVLSKACARHFVKAVIRDEMPTSLVREPRRCNEISGSMETETVVEAISERTSPTKRTSFWTLALGSIGVVYGDIGTSPLYALKESLTAASAGGALTADMVIGVMSLMLWALTIIVTFKYVLLIMRADNQGEGGTLTLMALLQRVMGRNFFVISLMGMAGAALFYGDAIITPAISVLSAVEGLKLVAPAFDSFILPLSMIILVGLFAVQSWGTAAVAAWFGPITMIWFVVLATGGLINLFGDFAILAAINPVYGIDITRLPRKPATWEAEVFFQAFGLKQELLFSLHRCLKGGRLKNMR